MKTNKIFALAAVLFAAIFASKAFAQQQITKFAVVDTGKVYQAYFRNSAPVRNYETKKAEFQAEVTRLTDELQDLHDKAIDLKKSGNEAAALKIEGQITKKAEFLTEYTSAKNSELESLKSQLQNNDAFYKKLYNTLESVAEKGGYSMILSLQQANAVLWYSPSVDITELVISELGL